MGTPVATDYEGILDAIRDWPAEKRLDLSREILATIQPHEQLYSDSFRKYIEISEESHMFGEARSSAGKILLIVLDRRNGEPPETGTQPRRKHTLEKALGLLATDHPAPSDAEVEQWLEQQRTEKYG